MSKFGGVSKTHKKHINFHNRSGSPSKLTSKVSTIGVHIVSKFQPCTPIISKVIAKSGPSNSFQDHLISRPLYFNLGQNQPYGISCQEQPLCICLGHISIPVKTLVPNQHQNRLFSNSFQDPCFSLFAAQWLQESSYSTIEV